MWWDFLCAEKVLVSIEELFIVLSKILWYAGDDIILSDDKLFVLRTPHHVENDRIWAVESSVWGDISKKGALSLVFIEKEVKKLTLNIFSKFSTSSNKIKLVQDWCLSNLTDFIPKEAWQLMQRRLPLILILYFCCVLKKTQICFLHRYILLIWLFFNPFERGSWMWNKIDTFSNSFPRRNFRIMHYRKYAIYAMYTMFNIIWKPFLASIWGCTSI